MENDIINGCFELFGGTLLWINVARLLRDKRISGVYWPTTGFFAAWGLWNLFYYPSLGQWFSFAGGVFIVLANLVWVALAFRYRRNHA